MNNALIQSLIAENFAPERIVPAADMSKYTTFRVGGPADVLVNAALVEDIPVALQAARRIGAPVTIIGNGSNLLVRDGGIRGLVIRLSRSLSKLSVSGDLLTIQAGASLRAAAQFALEQGLSGMAELAGIPGTIGGGTLMNAGAYGAELGSLITEVRACSFHDGHTLTLPADMLGFSYRHSALMDMEAIITEVTLRLTPGDPALIRARMSELSAARAEKQPLEYPSAGSTFKRPKGLFAAKLIDDCGLRGLRVGSAQVSEKHAGFIVNLGGATARDILDLMDLVSRRVSDQFGVALEPEVRILGEDAPDSPHKS